MAKSRRTRRIDVTPTQMAQEFDRLEWAGSQVGGEMVCPSCGRHRDQGHCIEPPCILFAIRKNRDAGSTAFTKRTAMNPELRGCNTCQLAPTCSRFEYIKEGVRRHGALYHGIIDGRPPVGAGPDVLMLQAAALEAETCLLWEEAVADE